MKYLYTFFHLNLAYSSIEQEQRLDVIEKCYWPILKLASKQNVPIGIELTGWTLETIYCLDPKWVVELAELCDAGLCELIGSGYSQIIGPLVPNKMLYKNLDLGFISYEKYLRRRPDIALINEQAYSKSLVTAYIDGGFKGLIMEWENPFTFNSNWPAEFKNFPQLVVGDAHRSIPIIWNHSLSFQNFQSYAHGQLDCSDLLDFLKRQCLENGYYSIYGSDAETFDFRTRRFGNELELDKTGEWSRIRGLFENIKRDSSLELISVREVLEAEGHSTSLQEIELTTVKNPITVKKQNKYNVGRWAVSGRGDLYLNKICYRYYKFLLENNYSSDDEWRELCYLWSSDFRTHITESRWAALLSRIKALPIYDQESRPIIPPANEQVRDTDGSTKKGSGSYVSTERYIIIETYNLRVSFDKYRGLALDEVSYLGCQEIPIVGTLKKGFFDNINLLADFYSGHLVFEQPGCSKVTDLVPMDPTITVEGHHIILSGVCSCPHGQIYKTWEINLNTSSLKCRYDLDWAEKVYGRLRLGYLTLNPLTFDCDNAELFCHNGGLDMERFQLGSDDFDNGAMVSLLVSMNHGFGMTEGYMIARASDISVKIYIDRCKSPMLGLVSLEKVRSSHLTRLCFSAMEIDDTLVPQLVRDHVFEVCLDFEKNQSLAT